MVVKRLGRHAIFTRDQEREFVNCIVKFSKLGLIPLTSNMIRAQAFAFCQKYNIPNNFSKKFQMAGKSWLQMFLKRNKILKISQPKDFHKSIKEIQKLYKELDIHDQRSN